VNAFGNAEDGSSRNGVSDAGVAGVRKMLHLCIGCNLQNSNVMR
jgi:hypothetical protein